MERPKNSEKSVQRVTLPTANPTWTGLRLNRVLRSKRPETDFLRRGLDDVLLLSEFLGKNIFKLGCGFWIFLAHCKY
jgi:hypothetical protein